MTDLPEVSPRAARLLLRREPFDVGRSQRLSRQRRAGSGGHVCFGRLGRNRHRGRLAGREGSTSTIRSACCRRTAIRPRLADDRIGYFVTAMKDYSHKVDEDRFVRYINRWDLQKADPSAELSPPKKPIVFWIEKTIPYKYPQADPRGNFGVEQGVREGRFRQCHRGPPAARQRRLGPGRHQLQHVPLDHFERRHSRWARRGPIPLTGQILNASVIFDADFLQFWKTEYEDVHAPGNRRPDRRPARPQVVSRKSGTPRPQCCSTLRTVDGESREMAFGTAVLAARAGGRFRQAEQDGW